MKKLILTSVCTLAVAGAAFAQGNVNWGSISFSSVTAQTNSTTWSALTGGGSTGGGAVGGAGGSASLGTGFYYALLYQASGSQLTAPTTLSSLAQWSYSGLMASNSATAGRLSVINGNAGATVPWGPSAASIMLVGWSASLGNNWTNGVLNNITTGNFGLGTFFGETSTGFIAPLDTSTSPGAALFGSAATAQGTPIFSLNTQLFELQPTPEPTTMALAGLGGLSFLALRRKK